MNQINESKTIMEALRAPFKPEEIEWRVQTASRNENRTKVLVLPYLTSRAVMNRLDHVVGGFWQSNFEKIDGVNPVAYQCRLSIKIGGEWIVRTDAAEASDIESVKGGHSNALKRAGVQWGIGRYLYDLQPFWVPLKNNGKHYVGGNFQIGGKKEYLKGYFDTPNLPNWALPPLPNNNQNQNNQMNNEPASNLASVQKQPLQNGPNQENPKSDHQESLKLVNRLLSDLQVHQNQVLPLLTKAIGRPIKSLTEASSKELGSLYHVLLPVCVYVNASKEFKLDEGKILYYAQIVLKEELKSIYDLFFKMTKEKCERTIAIMRSDFDKNLVG